MLAAADEGGWGGGGGRGGTTNISATHLRGGKDIRCTTADTVRINNSHVESYGVRVSTSVQSS